MLQSVWKEGFEAAARMVTMPGRSRTTGPDSGQLRVVEHVVRGATHRCSANRRPRRRYTRIYTLSPRPAAEHAHQPKEIDITRHFWQPPEHQQLPDGSYAVYGFPQFENCIVPVISQTART